MSEYNNNEEQQWDEKRREYVDHSKPRKDWTPSESMNGVKYLEAQDWTERGLTKKTLDRFGVKCKVSESMGPEKIEKVFFPYHNQEGKLTGYKVKDLTKDKWENGHFYAIGQVKTESQLFGQKQCRKSSRVLITCEGEADAMSVYQAYIDNAPEKYVKYVPAVTSIGCGTVQAVSHMTSNAKFVRSFPELRICYDNDRLSEAELEKPNPGMKGFEATKAVANHFMRMKVTTVEFPDWINDCSDYLQRGEGDALYKKTSFGQTEYHSEEIVGLYDKFKEGELFQPMTQGIYLKTLPKLMEKLLGVRPGELTLIMAPSGAGKSSISADIAYSYAKEGNGGVGGIFLEEGVKKTCNRFIARDLEIHPNKYKWGPEKHCSYEEYLKSEKWVGNTDNFLFLDHFGTIKIEELLDLAEILVYKHSVKFIVLDHISLTVGGDGNIDERVELEKAMKGLAGLCERSGVHIMVVSHINRLASSTSGKDREFTEPKWKRTFITDGKGTQALEALAWNIICIDVELMPDGTRGRIRLYLGKNREADEMGFCDIVRMDNETGVFYDASAEKWIPPTDGYGGE